MRGWRNRQTRWIQVPVPARAWGFNSPLAHQMKAPQVSDLGGFLVVPLSSIPLSSVRIAW